MDLISSNLANIHTTRTPEGGPYRRKRLVLKAVPAVTDFGKVFESRIEGRLRKVKVLGIKDDAGRVKMVYDPSHPDADRKGFVAMPNISLVEEMVNMLMATRSYEANVAAINAAKQMAMEALKIGQ
jgi:flagellar basal-body rod protein FlgC